MKITDFKKAKGLMPNCILSFDPFSHKTVSDLRFIVQHEIDLYEEGENNDIKGIRDIRACRKFLEITA